MENKNTVEAIAWIKKYFIDDSLEYLLLFIFIIGINDNKLISNPIHVPSHV